MMVTTTTVVLVSYEAETGNEDLVKYSQMDGTYLRKSLDAVAGPDIALKPLNNGCPPSKQVLTMESELFCIRELRLKIKLRAAASFRPGRNRVGIKVDNVGIWEVVGNFAC